MAERRKGGRKKSNDQNQKLTKEEDAIARYVRFNCPTKTTMFEGNEVHYFTGAKAVDTLYESKKYGHAAKTVKFATRQAVVTFMRTLLEKGLFFRARKLVPKKKDDKKDHKEKARGDVSKSPKKKSTKEDHPEKEKEKDNKEEKREESEDNEEESRKGKKKEEEEKRKRKIKLELHQEQSFNDTNDVYVWIFDPTPLFKKVIGALMVLGTIAGCLFPLWPIWLRQGVYYLSMAGLACFGLLIGVAVARTILFAIIWATTLGRHKLWLLPNLTEDCGFFESFQPWYTYEYCPGGITVSGKKKKKSDGKKRSGEQEPLLDKEGLKSDGHDSPTAVDNEKMKKQFRKSKEVIDDGENANFGNGDESDETDEEKTDAASDSDDGSDQETGGSVNLSVESESADQKVRLRRPARKADDDFILVDE